MVINVLPGHTSCSHVWAAPAQAAVATVAPAPPAHPQAPTHLQAASPAQRRAPQRQARPQVQAQAQVGSRVSSCRSPSPRCTRNSRHALGRRRWTRIRTRARSRASLGAVWARNGGWRRWRMRRRLRLQGGRPRSCMLRKRSLPPSLTARCARSWSRWGEPR